MHYRQKLQPVYKTTDKEAAANPISSFLRCVDRVSDITSCSAFVLESSVTIEALVLSAVSYLHHLSLGNDFTNEIEGFRGKHIGVDSFQCQ